jgi:hypothetical protein
MTFACLAPCFAFGGSVQSLLLLLLQKQCSW